MRNHLLLLLLLLALAAGGPFRAQSDPAPAPPDTPAVEDVDDETAPAVEAPPGPDMTEANELILEGSYAEAEEILARLSVEFPDDSGLLLIHGEVLLALQRADDALVILRKSEEIKPAQPRVSFQIASGLPPLGTKVDNEICRLDHVQIMFNHHNGVACVTQALQDLQ